MTKSKIVKIKHPSHDSENVYYKGKHIGLLSEYSFEQLSGNKNQIFDADKMVEVLTELGIKHNKPILSCNEKQQHIRIKIK